ncbi:MAG: S41 family peptidase [Caldilineaceae bacterium]
MTIGYYRFPTIHSERIAFVSEDDLWEVPVSGGVARRLTANLGGVTYPFYSPNGAWLAFVGREEGNPEIYTMPADGGEARRLTYLSSDCRILGWSRDGTHILFMSAYGQAHRGEYEIYRIPVDAANGAVEKLPFGPARSLDFGPDRGIVLGRNTGDPARWKRYRGGTAGHLWLDQNGDGDFQPFLADVPGNIASPMWIVNGEAAGRIYFVSDHEGIGNLYSARPDASNLTRHTDHEDYYVRNPSSDGKRIVYHAGADLFVFDPASAETHPVPVTYRSSRVQRNRKFVYAGRYLDSAGLNPKGSAIAITTRGKAFAFHNHEGAVLQLGERDGVRYRLAEYLNDSKRLLLVSDASGEERLEIHSREPGVAPQVLDKAEFGRAIAYYVSPTHDRVALTNHRHELLLIDLESQAVTLIDHSPFQRISGVDWSPDGRWLAYAFSATHQTTEIRLYRLADPDAEDEALHEGQVFPVTRPVLRDVRPAFDAEGRYLYFLSYREFTPVSDALSFALSFPRGARPYLITLQADLPNPFIPQAEEEPDKEENEDDEDEIDEDEDDTGEEGGEGDDEEVDDEESEDDLPLDDDLEGEDPDDDYEDDYEDDGDDPDGYGDDEEESRYSARFAAFHSQRRGANGLNDTDSREQQANNTPAEKDSSEAKGKDGKEGKSKRQKRIRIDLEGITDRVLAFPVPEGRYGRIAGAPGKAVFTILPIKGSQEDDDDEEDGGGSDGLLRAWNFKEFRAETLVEGVQSFDISRNRKKLIYLSHSRLRVIPAGEKPASESGSPRKTGWIDLSRAKVSVDPQSEWEQMFREAWRLQRDHFWNEEMSEVDWQTVYQRYFPLIQRVGSRSEFSDLMWEMQGELGTSHAYEIGGDYRPRPSFNQGFLGANATWDAGANGYRLDGFILGDPWDSQAHSPLAAPGVDVRPGDLLVAVNGQPLSAAISPAQLLVNQAQEEVLLTIRREKETGDQPETAKNGGPESNASENGAVTPTSADAKQRKKNNSGLHTTTVHTLANERAARYRAWVNDNRRRVHEASDGQVGYVHIPDMGSGGYAEFHRGYLAEVDKPALIVDVRFNGGGNVSSLLLDKLARRRLGYDLERWGGYTPYPRESVAGPLLALTNEHAGSDGDIFSHSFKMMGLGPLVGKRTWGGVVGIWPRHALVDGTVTTQPEFSFWFEDVGWNVENYGTDPDIEVDITPQDYRDGRDTQLERSIEEILKLLEANPPMQPPDASSRPSRALPKLPPRA